MAIGAYLLPHIGAALRRDIDDQRDLSFWWVQIQNLFRRDRKADASSGDRRPRGDTGGQVKFHRVG